MVKPINIKFALGGFNEVIAKQKNLNNLISVGKKEAIAGVSSRAVLTGASS